MLVKSTIAVAMATMSLAAPAVEIIERQSSSSSGVVGLYPNTNLGYDRPSQIIPINVDAGAVIYCQQFQPAFQGPQGFKSWIGNNILFIGFSDSNCKNSTTVISAKAATRNNNFAASGLLSFTARYQAS